MGLAMSWSRSFCTDRIAWKRQLGSGNCVSRPPIIRFNGFTYGSMQPSGDLVGHLEAIAHSLKHRQGDGSTALEQPWLVTIALDGEKLGNLSARWQALPREPLSNPQRPFPVETRKSPEFLDSFPATANLSADQLHSGSWVDGSFTVGPDQKIARFVGRSKELCESSRSNRRKHLKRGKPCAAEGSDWFWWFGEVIPRIRMPSLTDCFRTPVWDLQGVVNSPHLQTTRSPRGKLTTDRKVYSSSSRRTGR